MKITKYLLIITVLIISNKGYSQANITDCLENIHGDGHVHIDCDNDVSITSTTAEGLNGSIIYGLITTSENHSIRVLPGYSSVSITYEPPSPDGRIHKTRMGGNHGGGSDRIGPLKLNTNEVMLSPNPVESFANISSKKLKLSNVKIYNIQGQVLKNLDFTPQLDLNIDMKELKSGVFIIEIQLENGNTINKSIIKQ